MTTFNWTIETCEHEVATGGITVAHWRVQAEDGDYTTGAYGTVSFTPDVNAAGFVSYDQVTEAEVLAWVWASVNKTKIEENLQTQINVLKNPVVTSGKPWND